MITEVVVGMLLGLQSFWDVKRRYIPSYITMVGAFMGAVFSAYEGRSVRELLMALFPGLAILLLGRITQEAIGYGDGMLIGMLGMFYNLDDVVFICMSAFLCSAGISLMMLVIGNKKRTDTLPFVPFLLIGWIIRFLLMKGVV